MTSLAQPVSFAHDHHGLRGDGDRRVARGHRGCSVRPSGVVGGQERVRMDSAVQQGRSEAIRQPDPPSGPILAVRTADPNEKEAILAAHPRTCFTIPHFDGFAAVLVDIDNTGDDELRELIVDGWLVYAPKDVAETFLAGD